jgi:ATP-dependent Clp protease protease subunit
MRLSKEQKNKYFKMKQLSASKGEIWIYGEITSFKWDESDVTASSFRDELKALGDVAEIDVYINSGGGSVFEGIAIHNMLKQHKAKITAHIDALAASVASVIAMAADVIIMPKNSMMMIHNAWNIVLGNAKELRKAADDLDRINQSSIQSYKSRGLNISDEELERLLDEETWLNADQCLEYGFCDVVEDANQMAASITKKQVEIYQKVPEKVIEMAEFKQKQMVETPKDSAPTELTEQEKLERQQIIESCKNTNLILGGIA